MPGPFDQFVPAGAAPAPRPPVIPGADTPPPAPQIATPAPVPDEPAPPTAAPAEPAPPQPPEPSPFDTFLPKGAAPKQGTAVGAAMRAAAPNTLPTIGAFPAAGAGAAAGGVLGLAAAPLAAPIGAAIGRIGGGLVGDFAAGEAAAAAGGEIGLAAGPIGAAVGAIGGGLAGGFLGGAAINSLQNWAIRALPNSLKRTLGFNEQQQSVDAQQHPWATTIGGVLPVIATMNPFRSVREMMQGGTSLQTLLQNQLTHRLIGGAAMAGMTAAQEKTDGQLLNWQQIAIAAGTGTFFDRPYKYMDALGHAGGELGAKLANLHQPMPTVAQGGDVNVIGPGITESVFHGTEQQTPETEAVTKSAASMEKAATQPPSAPDMESLVRQMHPDLFQRYDTLQSQAQDLRSWIDNEKNPEPDDIQAAKDKLDYANGQLHDALNPPMGAPRSRDVPRLRAIATDAQNQYNDLSGRAAAWSSGTAEDTAGTALARQHLQAINDQLSEMAPHIGDAYRRAAETPHGIASQQAEQPTSPEAPTSEEVPGATEQPADATQAPAGATPVRSLDAQRAAIAADVARRRIASGASRELAEADGQIAAAYYVTRAQRMGGALGTPEELYRDQGAGIAGPGGQPLMPTIERPEIGPRPPEPPAPPAPGAPEPPPPPGPGPAPEPPRRPGPEGHGEMPLAPPAEPRPAPTPAEATAAEPSPAAQPKREVSPVSDIESLDPAQIGVDAERFQFKAGGDEAGVTDRLDGVKQWDARLAGTVLVFRDADGKDWIADGHQRAALAQRLAETQPGIRLNAFVLKAEDGMTDARARFIAAAKNIAEGTGTSVDAAKVLREAGGGDFEMPPLPPRSTLVREGRALARLSPDAFGMAVNEVIPTNQAAIVGRLVSDPLVQEEAMRVLARVKPDNVRQADLIVRQIMDAGTNLETNQASLFGEETFASSTVLERAKIADVAMQQLRRDKAVFAVLTNEAERIVSHGENILDTASNRSRLTDDERATDLLTSLATRRGPVSDTLTAIAQRFKGGEISAANAAREFLEAVRGHIQGGLAAGDVAGGAELGAAGEREGAEVTTPEGQFDLLDGGSLPAAQHEAFADRAAGTVWSDFDSARSGDASPDLFAPAGDMFTTEGGEDLLAVSEPAGDTQVVAAEPDENGQTEISLHNPEEGSIEPIGKTDFKQTASMVRDEQPAPVGAPLPDDADEAEAEVLRRSAAPETAPDTVAERDIAATSAPVVVPEPERAERTNTYEGKWYGTQAKAEAFIEKMGIGATHEVVQEGKRFLIRQGKDQEPHVNAEEPRASNPPADAPNVAPERPAAQEPAYEGTHWRIAGENRLGEDIYEDDRSIRSIVRHGVRFTEPVTINPRGGISTNRDIHDEFQLAEPAAEPTRENAQVEQPAQSDNVTAEPAPVEPAQQQEEPTNGEGGVLQQRPGEVREGAPSVPEGEQSDVSGAADPIRQIEGAPARRERGRRGNAQPDDAGAHATGPRPKADNAGAAAQVTRPPASNPRVRAPRPDTPAAAGTAEARVKAQKGTRSNYRITDADELGEGGKREKIQANIEAVRTLKQIEDEARDATPEEKAKLVKYTGWGAFAQDMFADRHGDRFKGERESFRALATDEEYAAARTSTLNAHYTSPDVIKGMWDSLIHLGYDGGLALEPSAGVGHFIGLTPDGLAPRTAWTGVELDSLTGRIAKALYGKAEINVQGFETLRRPSNYYDLAVSNVPFGDYKLSEKPYGRHSIHDFFFVKSLDKVRPGGVVSFITSRYTMDKVDSAMRRELAKHADLVGAIRLPGGSKGAFASNAGTEVTTDIIYLRKKVPGEAPFPGADWTDLKEIKTPDGPVSINQYFADNPHMMLGEMRLQGSMYRGNEPVLVGEAEGIRERIAEAASHMPAGAFAQREAPPPPTISTNDAPTAAKEGSFFLKGGAVHRIENGIVVAKKLSKPDVDKVTHLSKIRDIYNDLLSTQINAADNAAEQSEHLRGKLRDEYDAFVAKHGPINRETRTVTTRQKRNGEYVMQVRRPNFAAFEDDPDAYKVAAIENYDAETDTAARADAQTKDVITKPEARQINSPGDALAAVLDSHGRVDLQEIGRLLGAEDEGEVAARLGEQIYQNPDGRQWETADSYLSGDVVQKLEDARDIAQSNPGYMRNVAALEGVQPTPLQPDEITALFGAPWVPADVYEDYLHGVGANKASVSLTPITGEWKLQADRWSRDALSKYGTDRVDPGRIAEGAINNKKVTVYDRGPDDKPVVNQDQTELARVKVEALKDGFTGNRQEGVDSWVWSEPMRAERLSALYNRTYNNLVNRRFDGSHQTFPGMSASLKLRPHQSNAVWRVVQSGNTLLGHEVGAGKTFTMIAAAMEQKRLGLIKKPMFVVPNHMLEQFSREFLQAYPDAKILIASKDDVGAKARKAFVSKVAANDWDGVVITHNSFGSIGMSHESQQQFVQEQIDEIEKVRRAAAEENGDKDPTVKELEKLRKKAEDRLAKLMKVEAKDEGTTFEESGVDHVIVDEAHLFKNLAFTTRMTRVKGLSQGDSQRAEDLFMKIRYLEQKRPGRSAVFATGTPVSNTMAELWTMMRYLMLDKLRETGLDNFDSWANTFGRTTTNMALAADGRSFKEETSFNRFVNMPELISLYSQVADTQTAAMLNLPRPEVQTRTGAPGVEIVQAEPSVQEEAYIDSLVKLAESLKGKRPEPGQPNMLSVVTNGRKVATDGRLIDPDNFAFNPQGKLALAVQNIARIYHEGKEPALAQLIFLDMGVPNAKNQNWDAAKSINEEDADFDNGGEADPAQAEAQKINLYTDMRHRLAAEGVDPKDVAFIHDADDDMKKARLFESVRRGDVRILLGSTGKMGVGTNVQKRLIAMHHLDAPWKPAEIQQRDGRILRQGNLNSSVQIYRYVTKRSFDAFMWQKLDSKAAFIGQMLSGVRGAREMEDVDSPLPEAEEMKAAASGDPRIMEHAELSRQVRQLESQRRAFQGTISRATWELKAAKSRVEMAESALPAARADAAKIMDISGDKFRVKIGGAAGSREYDSRKDAGAELVSKLTAQPPQHYWASKDVLLGHMSGLEMRMEMQAKVSGGDTYLAGRPYLAGEQRSSSPTEFAINAQTDPVGLMKRFENLLGQVARQPAAIENATATERDNIGKLSSTLQATWPREEEYTRTRQQLVDLTTALKAKDEPKAPEITGEEDEAAEQPGGGVREFSQAMRRGVRQGFIRLTQGARPIITMLADHNASTFIHESAHQWLEDMHADSQHPASSMQLRRDMETVHNFLGTEQGGKISTRAHEKFSRAFERYMREGRAPSSRLAGVFEKFKGWLMDIYQSVKQLGGPINDDVRRVFDRMLELEPNHQPIISAERPRQPGIADVHETDAAETEPAEAEGAGDRVSAEAQAYETTQAPEVSDAITAATEADAAATGARPGNAAPGAQPGDEAGAVPGNSPEMGQGGSGPNADAGRGGGGEQSGAEPPGGGEAVPESGNVSGQPASGAGAGRSKPKSAAEYFTPGPKDRIDTDPDSQLVDKAGNIRVENLTTRADVAQAIHEAAERGNDFMQERRGVLTDGDVMNLADALGMDAARLNMRRIGQAFNAEQVMAARRLLVDSAHKVAGAMKKAANGTDQDLIAYAEAKDRHQMIQAQVAGITAEAGRALRAFRNITDQEGTTVLNQFIKQATGRTLMQLKIEAKMGAELDTPEKVSKMMADAQKNSFGRMLFEYYQNNLLSGPATHITYAIGNELMAFWRGVPDVLAAAAIGRARAMLGREGEHVLPGEALAQVQGHIAGLAPATAAAIRAFRTGATGSLPGETEAFGTVMQQSLFQKADQLNVSATWGDAMSEMYGLMRGIKDGIMTVGPTIKAGMASRQPGEARMGWVPSSNGLIPNAHIYGQTIPVGATLRLSGRMIASVHTFFRAANYSRTISAEAYRTAANEGRTGMDMASRMADLRLNPSEPSMNRAHDEANSATLMDQGGAFTRKLTGLLNHAPNLPGLGETPIFRFAVPFVQIADNMLRQAYMERSPLGMVSPQMRADLMSKDNLTSDMAAARMLTGTAFALLFGGLAAQGYATGSGPSDPRKAALWRMAGNQENSFRIGETWVQIGRLGPLAMLAGTAADTYDVAHQAAEGELTQAGGTLVHAFAQNILDASFLSGVSDLLNAIERPEEYGGAYVRQQLVEMVPFAQGLSQVAHQTDPYTRQAQGLVGALKSRIPGLSETEFARRDIFGEQIPSPDPAAPMTEIYLSHVSADPVVNELLRLNIAPASMRPTIRNIHLNPQQYDDYTRIGGRLLKISLQRMIQDPQWSSVPDDYKREAINHTIIADRNGARELVMHMYPQIAAEATAARLAKLQGDPQ